MVAQFLRDLAPQRPNPAVAVDGGPRSQPEVRGLAMAELAAHPLRDVVRGLPLRLRQAVTEPGKPRLSDALLGALQRR